MPKQITLFRLLLRLFFKRKPTFSQKYEICIHFWFATHFEAKTVPIISESYYSFATDLCPISEWLNETHET